jgi:hypothetical protein
MYPLFLVNFSILFPSNDIGRYYPQEEGMGLFSSRYTPLLVFEDASLIIILIKSLKVLSNGKICRPHLAAT